MVPNWNPPVQSAVSVTVSVSCPDDGCVPSTTTLESARSGCDVSVQVPQSALGDGAGENVTMIWSPNWARPAVVPPLTMVNEGARGVTEGERPDGTPEPTALVPVTVKE